MASLKEKWQTHNASLGLFVATMAWGASFFLVKKASAMIGVWPFLFWRFGLATLFMVLVFPNKALRANLKIIRSGFILGGLLFLTIFTQTLGLQLTTASKAGFITALYVPMVPILGWVFLRKRSHVTYRHFLVAFISMLGLYILTDSGGHLNQWWQDVNPGDLWTLATAVFAAIHILVTERITREEPDSIALGLWQFIGCFTFISIGAFFVWNGPGPFIPLTWNPFSWPTFALGSVVFNALISTCFGFIMQIICQKTLGALKSALIFAMEAPLATGFAFLFMNELFTPKEFIGAIIVFLVSIVPDKWLKT